MSSFTIDLSGLESKVTELGVLRDEIQVNITKQQAQIDELQEALSAAQAAYSAALAAYSKNCAERAKAAALNGTSVSFDAPPSDSGVQAAQAALEAAVKILQDLQNDINAIDVIVTALNTTKSDVQMTESEALQYIYSALSVLTTCTNDSSTKIQEIVLNPYTGTDTNAYVVDRDGNKVYVSMYNNLSREEYCNLSETLGVDGVVSLLLAQGKTTVEILYNVGQLGVTTEFIANVKNSKRDKKPTAYTTTYCEKMIRTVGVTGLISAMMTDGISEKQVRRYLGDMGFSTQDNTIDNIIAKATKDKNRGKNVTGVAEDEDIDSIGKTGTNIYEEIIDDSIDNDRGKHVMGTAEDEDIDSIEEIWPDSTEEILEDDDSIEEIWPDSTEEILEDDDSIEEIWPD
jgi:hypothetical protein